MIKGNESDVADIIFGILAKKEVMSHDIRITIHWDSNVYKSSGGFFSAPKISIVSNSISAKLPPLPISSATKKSFHNDLTSNLVKNEMRNASSNPELNKIGTSSPA